MTQSRVSLLGRRAAQALLASLFVAVAAAPSHAATATNSLTVTMTITAQCVTTGGTLAFGSHGLLTANVDQTGTFAVTCTNGTPYTVALDQGLTGASVTTRKMHSPTTGEDISYALYLDASRLSNWGNSVGSLLSNTGTGSAQTITVYGRVAPQATPSAGTDYSDTVTITVSY